MDRMVLIKFVCIILSFIVLAESQSLCHDYMSVSCEAYTSTIAATVEHGYCEGQAEAECYAYAENVKRCKSRFGAMKFRPHKEKCGDSNSMSDCMADTMVKLFTGAKVSMKCRNGAGSVAATSIAYACIFAKDYADIIADANDERDVDEIAGELLTSYSDARCAVQSTGYGECRAFSEGYASNYKDRLRTRAKRRLHCESDDDEHDDDDEHEDRKRPRRTHFHNGHEDDDD